MAKSIPRGVGSQIPRGDYSEVSQKEPVRKAPEARWRGDSGSVLAARNSPGGRASDAGPYPRVPNHCSETQRCICDRVYQEKERSTNPPAISGEQACEGCISGADGTVETVGLDAEMIRKYFKYQEKKEQQIEQLNLGI